MRQGLNIDTYDKIYFIGIGGIGMSALARYFHSIGKIVAGYDKTKSALTDQLEKEGISVHFEDLGPSIPVEFRDSNKTLVVITPAVPQNLGERLFFVHHNFKILKRAEVLGLITRSSKALCVAGTHGKTTTSAMLSHILSQSSMKCSAFLGGISSNINSNFLTDENAEFTVIEADEFDRSFLQLRPFASIVTTTDADHLDIYGDQSEFLNGFQEYADLIDPAGKLIKHESVQLQAPNSATYSIEGSGDYNGQNLRYETGSFFFDLDTPTSHIKDVQCGLPGIHNAENAIACYALCEFIGLESQEILDGIRSFKGVKRRFEMHVKSERLVYIDDYAHHPTEINALITSLRLLYPDKKIYGIFQPHLFSRTRDFFDGFVSSLSQLDSVTLLPIYPAREEPINGINSEALVAQIQLHDKSLLTPEETIKKFKTIDSGVVVTIGAGDIDRIVEPLKNGFEEQ
jgi:UDP-N-acetylmuramate--alanine ligase